MIPDGRSLQGTFAWATLTRWLYLSEMRRNRDYYLHGCREYVCKHCHRQSSVTAGTVLHRTHLLLTIWFWVVYLAACDKRGISAVQLSSEMKIAYSSAWYLLHRWRKAMGQSDQAYVLSGVVGLDNACLGASKPNGKRGGGTEKSNVLAAVSRSEQGHPGFFKIQVSKLDTAAVRAVARRAFVLAAKSTAMPSGLFVPRCVRATPIITRSLTRAAALCAGYTP